MAAGLKNWWSKRFGAAPTFVEKDGGLYPSRIRVSLNVDLLLLFIYLCVAPLFFIDSYINTKISEWWILIVFWAASVIFYLFLYLLALGIERHRFGPLGQPLAQVGQDTLTLAVRHLFFGSSQIKLRLPELHSLHIGANRSIRVKETHWDEFTATVPYGDAPTKAAVIDFLRRKLPASVQFTTDDPAGSKPI